MAAVRAFDKQKAEVKPPPNSYYKQCQHDHRQNFMSMHMHAHIPIYIYINKQTSFRFALVEFGVYSLYKVVLETWQHAYDGLRGHL